ncbi:MAG: hypothetical protein MUC31_01925 [Bacteroidales bacterium]|nr:hypothetical protein [Bacteroidales bacterium]
MKILKPVIFILLVFLSTSCFKEDEKIEPHDPGDVKTVTIGLTNDYRYQVYFDLGSGEQVSQNLKKTWDLGFESSEKGWKIILNSSNFMVAAASGQTDFTMPSDTAGLTWNFDASSGNPDSLAFGTWVGFIPSDSTKVYSNEIFIIDRGYDEAGNLRGLRKVVFQEVDDSSYTFRYANLDGSHENTFTVMKDPSVNYACFSFDEGGKQLSIEPPKLDWDLVFTQYTTLLYTNEGDPYPYLLTGVLNNSAGIEVAQDTLYDFSSIDLDIAGSLVFTDALDEIGYDWKDVVGDVGSGSVSYVIVEGLNYVVKDMEGYYYKLRFISFYNNSGEKGYPTFEYQKL